MASCIFPSEATRRRVPRFSFPDCSPQLYGLDDELCRHYLLRPSWPLSISGFDRDAAWTVNQWARTCAAQDCPMADGDTVSSMTFMMNDDNGFRAWRSGRQQGPNGAPLVSSNL